MKYIKYFFWWIGRRHQYVVESTDRQIQFSMEVDPDCSLSLWRVESKFRDRDLKLIKEKYKKHKKEKWGEL